MVIALILGLVVTFLFHQFSSLEAENKATALSNFGFVYLVAFTIALLGVFAISNITDNLGTFEEEVVKLEGRDGLYLFPGEDGQYTLITKENVIMISQNSQIDFFADLPSAEVVIKKEKFSLWWMPTKNNHKVSLPQGGALCVPDIFCPEAGYYSE